MGAEVGGTEGLEVGLIDDTRDKEQSQNERE